MAQSINIAGVVGVGKSSLCKILGNQGWKVYYEPVFDNELLERFYHDKERWSFALQIYFLNKRFEMYKDSVGRPENGENVIMDRSIVEDRIFAKMLRDREEMVKEEYDVYLELYNNMMDHVTPPDLMVYLRIKPERAIERISKRGRDYELEQNTQYWYELNKNYEVFFNEYRWSNLLVIDVDDLDFVHSEEDRNFVLNQIKGRLKELGKPVKVYGNHEIA